MWNDLFESFPNPFGCSVNEFDPIDNEVNDVNPSILNVDTSLNLLFPIFNDCNEFKFDNWNIVEFPNDPSPIDSVVNEGKSTMLVKHQYINSIPLIINDDE